MEKDQTVVCQGFPKFHILSIGQAKIEEFFKDYPNVEIKVCGLNFHLLRLLNFLYLHSIHVNYCLQIYKENSDCQDELVCVSFKDLDQVEAFMNRCEVIYNGNIIKRQLK